jgi:hypothetical protein
MEEDELCQVDEVTKKGVVAICPTPTLPKSTRFGEGDIHHHKTPTKAPLFSWNENRGGALPEPSSFYKAKVGREKVRGGGLRG